MLTEIIQDAPALLAIKDEWQALSAAIPQSICFFGGWDHVWHAVTVLQPEKWFVVTIREPEKRRLVAVFAWELLNLQTTGKTYRAVQPLAPGLTPYVEFPVELGFLRPALQSLLNDVLSVQVGVDVVCLWPLHEASPLFNALTEDMRHSEMLKTFRYPGNLCEIETRGLNYVDYCRSKPSNSFANALRYEKQLKKEGELRFTLCEPLPAAVDIVEKLCSASAMRFGEQFAYRSRPGWKAWAGKMVAALADQGIAQVSTLRFDGVIIAGGLSFWHKGRRYFYLTHYDRAYAKRSPGKILLYYQIEQTFEDKGVFCFGAGTFGYKEAWAQSAGELKAAFIFLNADTRQGLDSVIDRNFIVRLGQV